MVVLGVDDWLDDWLIELGSTSILFSWTYFDVYFKSSLHMFGDIRTSESLSRFG